MALLLTKKVIVLVKCLDFTDVFLKKSANVLSKTTGANKHKIKLEKGKKPPYRPIDSPRPIEFEIFKICKKTNMVNGFIRALKSPIGTLVLFGCKLNSSFYLYLNYQELNNLTIKN